MLSRWWPTLFVTHESPRACYRGPGAKGWGRRGGRGVLQETAHLGFDIAKCPQLLCPSHKREPAPRAPDPSGRASAAGPVALTESWCWPPYWGVTWGAYIGPRSPGYTGPDSREAHFDGCELPGLPRVPTRCQPLVAACSPRLPAWTWMLSSHVGFLYQAHCPPVANPSPVHPAGPCLCRL